MATIKFKFEPSDVWVGIYWTKTRITNLTSDEEYYHIYLCLIPGFPVIFTFKKTVPDKERYSNW